MVFGPKLKEIIGPLVHKWKFQTQRIFNWDWHFAFTIKIWMSWKMILIMSIFVQYWVLILQEMWVVVFRIQFWYIRTKLLFLIVLKIFIFFFQFHKFEEIYRLGYNHANAYFAGMRKFKWSCIYIYSTYNSK